VTSINSKQLAAIKLIDVEAFDIPIATSLKVTRACLRTRLKEICEIKRSSNATIKITFTDYAKMKFWCELDLKTKEMILVERDSGDEQLNFLLLEGVTNSCLNLLNAIVAAKGTSIRRMLTKKLTFAHLKIYDIINMIDIYINASCKSQPLMERQSRPLMNGLFPIVLRIRVTHTIANSKRLSTWLLAVKMSFTEIDSDHLSRYLNDFALGKLDLDLNKQQQKKRSNCHSGKRCITPSL